MNRAAIGARGRGGGGWKSFEKAKQKVSSAAMKHAPQETGPGPDSTFHTIESQQ